jgi:hypothetical protein
MFLFGYVILLHLRHCLFDYIVYFSLIFAFEISFLLAKWSVQMAKMQKKSGV